MYLRGIIFFIGLLPTFHGLAVDNYQLLEPEEPGIGNQERARDRQKASVSHAVNRDISTMCKIKAAEKTIVLRVAITFYGGCVVPGRYRGQIFWKSFSVETDNGDDYPFVLLIQPIAAPCWRSESISKTLWPLSS